MGVVRLYTHAEISDLSKIMLKTVLKIKKNIDYTEKNDSSDKDQIHDTNDNKYYSTDNFDSVDSHDFKSLSYAKDFNDIVNTSVSFDAIQNNKHEDENSSFNRNESDQSFFHDDNRGKNLNNILNTLDYSDYNTIKKKKINIVLVRDNSVVMRSRSVSTVEAQITGTCHVLVIVLLGCFVIAVSVVICMFAFFIYTLLAGVHYSCVRAIDFVHTSRCNLYK
jgi:hypothetical protein